MPESAGYLEDLTDSILGIAGDYVRSEVRVSLQSNLLPEIPVYRGSISKGSGGGSGQGGGGGGKSLGDLLGIKAGVVVRNADGKVLATFGNPAPIDPLRAGVLLLLVGAIGYVFVRGLMR